MAKRTNTKTTKRAAKVWRNAFGQVEVPLGHPDAHTYRPARHCACLSCRVQRAQFCKRLVDHAVARAWDALPVRMGGRVIVGSNATDELRDLLTGGER